MAFYPTSRAENETWGWILRHHQHTGVRLRHVHKQIRCRCLRSTREVWLREIDCPWANSAGSYTGLLLTPGRPVINNTPFITLCTQMGRWVEGWWGAAVCVVSTLAASHNLYPSGILWLQPFVTGGPAEDSFISQAESLPFWLRVIYGVIVDTGGAVGFHSVPLEEDQTLQSCQRSA